MSHVGTWGSGILEDDFAADVASYYVERLYDGADARIAATETIREFGTLDVDEHSVFWLALAAKQLEYGRLTDDVVRKASEVIASGEDLTKWNGDQRRARVLAAFARKLRAPKRPPKSLPKRPPKLEQGDVFRLPLDDERYAFGRVLTKTERAFYRYVSQRKRPPLEEILRSEVMFVVGSTDDGFARRKWHVIANAPIEDRLRSPTYLYHRAVGEDVCTVFDIWMPGHETIKPVTECRGYERWGSWAAAHCRDRILAELEGRDCAWTQRNGD